MKKSIRFKLLVSIIGVFITSTVSASDFESKHRDHKEYCDSVYSILSSSQSEASEELLAGNAHNSGQVYAEVNLILKDGLIEVMSNWSGDYDRGPFVRRFPAMILLIYELMHKNGMSSKSLYSFMNSSYDKFLHYYNETNEFEFDKEDYFNFSYASIYNDETNTSSSLIEEYSVKYKREALRLVQFLQGMLVRNGKAKIQKRGAIVYLTAFSMSVPYLYKDLEESLQQEPGGNCGYREINRLKKSIDKLLIKIGTSSMDSLSPYLKRGLEVKFKSANKKVNEILVNNIKTCSGSEK